MNKIKILFLAANPTDTGRLKLDEEFRSITEKVRASEYRDSLELISAWAVRPDDLLQLLNTHKPHIVHFSGHGSQTGEILLVDNYGEVKPVAPRALKALLTTLKDNIRLVLLNACYSRTQAESIREVIDYVVGMNTSIGDSAAIIFAASFYRALGFGRSVNEAFDQGVTALLLEGIPEENTPEFFIREGVDSKAGFLSLEDRQHESQGEILKKAEVFLLSDDAENAYELLKTLPIDSELSGQANLLSALALMIGRPFNRMSTAERSKLEKHLNAARKKMNEALLPLVCLALLEIDYYNYNGQVSTNNISVSEIAQKVKNEKLSENDIRWLGLLTVSRDAKRSLGLTTQPGSNSAPSQNQQLAMNNYENTVFVSYAWGGESESIVDELERAFAERGIRVVRDKKELGYKGSIKAFEQRIGEGQRIILVISDKYLRSEHCMYELVEVDKNRNLRDRIFPIVLENAQIYKAIDRLIYIKHWDKPIEELNQAIKQVDKITNLSGITADLDKYASIRASFDHLTDLLSDMNALTPEMHRANGFSTLISAVEHTDGRK